MERIAVKSSALASMAYDASTETLEVQFHGKNNSPGKVHQYHPVPASVHAAMMLTGASIGSIFAREVRANPLVTGTQVDDEAVTA